MNARVLQLCGITAYVIGAVVVVSNPNGKVIDVALSLPDHKANVTEQDKTGKPLTPRELEALTHLVDGLSNNEIAEEMKCSPSTVKFFVDAVFEKLGVENRVQAAVHAVRNGMA